MKHGIRQWQRLLGSLLLLVCVATPAFATSLDDAKLQGYVGEQTNGYLGFVVSNPPQAVRDLVNQVNQQRRTHYLNIARSNNLPLPQVEKKAGEKLIRRSPQGYYIRSANGQWIKK